MAGYYEQSFVESITNEFVKSYGFRQDQYGNWGWSLENIQKSFKEEPFWTAIDYATLGIPVARWGGALRAVKYGNQANVAAQALQRGEVAARGLRPTRMGARALQRLGLADESTAAAAQLYVEGPSKLGHGLGRLFGKEWGGAFSNPVTTHLSDDWAELAQKVGMETWEKRGWDAHLRRERLFAQNVFQRRADDAARLLDSLDEQQQETISRGLEAGIDVEGRVFGGRAEDLAGLTRKGREELLQTQRVRAVERLGGEGGALADELAELSDEGKLAYGQLWQLRNSIHEEAFDLGLIPEETYVKHLQKYAPWMYEEYQRLGAAESRLREGTTRFMRGAGGSATERFQKRGLAPKEDLTRILSPKATAAELANVGTLVANQRYFQRLANSAITDVGDEVGQKIYNAVKLGDEGRRAAAALGLAGRRFDDMAAWIDETESLTGSINMDELANQAGWQSLETMFKGREIPGYIKRLPPALTQRRIDPAVVHDVIGLAKFGDDTSHIARLYQRTLSMFKVSKTVWNPATHVRNYIGNWIFSHLATGGFPDLHPTLGFKHMKVGDEIYEAAVKEGTLGGAFSQELIDAAQQLGKHPYRNFQGTTLDWAFDTIKNDKVRKSLRKGAGAMEDLYRFEDEVWKLHAFAKNYKRARKLGLEKTDAFAFAGREVNKYMPNFMARSPAGELASRHIPFASFQLEGLRVWKNALAEKPHLAFFWNHFVESSSYLIGAMNGYSMEEIDASKEALPHYMKNKKALIWPIMDEGRPQYIDFSYLMPMSNLVEAEQGESLFFDEIIDPTANPFVGAATVLATGVDPFSKRELDVRFTERQLGIPVTSERARRAVGLGEYMARLFLPPLVPPGYAGVNLLEYARGQASPTTGESLEEGVTRTIFSNLLGMRIQKTDIESQVLNVVKEQRDITKRVSESWDRWEFARANGDLQGMAAERDRIIGLKVKEEHDDPVGYFTKNMKRHQPGTYSNLSTKQIEEIIQRHRRIGGSTPRDRRIMGELMSRYQERTR